MKRNACPQTKDLWGFAQGSARWLSRARVMSHAARCGECFEKIASIKRMEKEGFLEAEVPEELNQAVLHEIKAKAAATRQGRRFKLESVFWFGGFLVFMALSFLVHRYFFQMIALALVAGAMWVTSIRTPRTHIQIIHEKKDAQSSETLKEKTKKRF